MNTPRSLRPAVTESTDERRRYLNSVLSAGPRLLAEAHPSALQKQLATTTSNSVAPVPTKLDVAVHPPPAAAPASADIVVHQPPAAVPPHKDAVVHQPPAAVPPHKDAVVHQPPAAVPPHKDAVVHPPPSPAAPLPVPPTNHEIKSHWPETITKTQGWTLGLLPFITLITTIVLLRVVWKKARSSPRFMTIPNRSREDESTPLSQSQQAKSSDKKNDIIANYESHWAQTCDSLLLTFMVISGIVLTVVTFFYEPKLLHSSHFWFMQLIRIALIMLIALCGGYLCRHFCEIDIKGYIVSSRSDYFDVQYTQKLLYFVTYTIPLINRSKHDSLLALFWGDFCCLLPLIFMIKPIREQLSFFMLQFNALDCPEQRPNTLKWSVFGNIVPGMFALAFFKWLFQDQVSFVYIIILITGIGTLFADIIGKIFGRHMFTQRGFLSDTTDVHSWESSACVLVFAMSFAAILYSDFRSFTQVLLAMLVLSPVITFCEAVAPHTAQTPILMLVSGAILYAISFF